MDKEKQLGFVKDQSARIGDLSQVRTKQLEINMDKSSGSVMNTSVIDKTGYLTSLDSVSNPEFDFKDLKKARLLIKSMIKSNPNSDRGWVVAARIEEMDGKGSNARDLL